MSEKKLSENSYNHKESISLMKQWIFTKLQQAISFDDSDNDDTHDDDYNSKQVPRIIISNDSDSNLQRHMAISVSDKRPLPLNKSWLNYKDKDFLENMVDDSPTKLNSATSVEIPRRLNFLDQQSAKRKDLSSYSVPNTPNSSFLNGQKRKPKPLSLSASLTSKSATDTVFKFSKSNRLLSDSDMAQVSNAIGSRSETSTSLVGYPPKKISSDFSGLKSTSMTPSQTSNTSALSRVSRCPSVQNSTIMRRRSSCRSVDTKRARPQQLTKAVSNVDVRKRESSKQRRIRRTGSKDKSGSSVCLSRSLSINLDTFKFVKTSSQKSSNAGFERKLSLTTDIELRGRHEQRRRSSLLKLLCIDKECDQDSISGSDPDDITSSLENILDSPTVTHRSISRFPSTTGRALSFQSTFETDSINVPSEFGQVKVMFQYYNEKTELRVTLLKGTNVARGKDGNLGVYAKVCLMPGKVLKKQGADKHNTQNPVLYELFSFRQTLDQLLNKEIRIKLYNKPGIFSRSEPIGECSIALFNYDLTAATVIWKNLKKCKGQKDDLDVFDFNPDGQDGNMDKPTSRFTKLLCGLGLR